MSIQHRTAKPEDLRFVISAWSSSLKDSDDSPMIQAADWSTIMHDQIAKVIARPDAVTIVAHDSDDPDHLYGFICVEHTAPIPLVFYCYVKQSYRRAGIGRRLFAAAHVDPSGRFDYTCRTRVVRLLSKPTLSEAGDVLKLPVIPYARYTPQEARYPKRRTQWR